MAAVAASAAPATSISDPDGNWTGYVLIDDQPVEVYKVEHKERKTTCFIEAVEGKEFKPGFRRKWKEADLHVSVVVDGTSARALAAKRAFPERREWSCSGARVSKPQIRAFIFAKMVVTDDPEEGSRLSRKFVNPRQHIVDERSKKATMSHTIAYGETQTSACSQGNVGTRIDSGSPYYTLEFKYRSRALLELEGAIEPVALAISPSPAPVASTSASSNGTGRFSPSASRKKRKSSAAQLEGENEDLRVKIARLEAENSQLKCGVKRENGDDDIKPLIKGEPIGKDRNENGRMVIDLLDEDDD